MKPAHIEASKEDSNKTTCSAEGKSCGCSKGMCPGVLLTLIFIAGWGLWTLGSWVLGILAG